MTDQIEFSKPGEWVMRITADRRIEVNDDVTVTEAAQTVIEAVQKLLEQPEQEPVHGDIRALKYRIHELEGEVIGYKRMLDVAEAPPRHKPLTDEIPIGVLTAITNAKLTLLKTAHGYELRKLGPIVAGLSMKGEA